MLMLILILNFYHQLDVNVNFSLMSISHYLINTNAMTPQI